MPEQAKKTVLGSIKSRFEPKSQRFGLFGHLMLISFFLFFQATFASLSQDTIYLTWQRSPSTTMTVQWISLAKEEESRIVYRSCDEMADWKMVDGSTAPFPQASQYAIHSVELTNLTPGREYCFKVPPFPEEYRFITAPESLSEQIRFVVGGDMYHDDLSFLSRTNRAAAKTGPLFAALGGDIAYAFPTSFFRSQNNDRWIDWVKSWHRDMVTPEGRLVPVVAAIGNHDLNGGFDQAPEQAAVFSALFPMPGKRVFGVLDFGPYLSLFLLDSGHANPIGGRQAEWLKKELEERPNTAYKMAVYHVPAYPSVRDQKNSYSEAIRSFWIPLFEQGAIQVAFEHHDHAYKRTHPLLNGKVHPNGIVYFGDGGWGVEKPRKLVSKPFYLAESASRRHFLEVVISDTGMRVAAIDDLGQQFDGWQKAIRKPDLVLKSHPQELK